MPAGVSLAVLSDQILQPAIGWARNYHGYAYEDPVDGAVLGPKEHRFIDMMHVDSYWHGMMDDRNVPLALLLRQVGDWCKYTYDLGDQFEFRIEVLEVIPPEDERHGKVSLVDGFGACRAGWSRVRRVCQAADEVPTGPEGLRARLPRLLPCVQLRTPEQAVPVHPRRAAVRPRVPSHGTRGCRCGAARYPQPDVAVSEGPRADLQSLLALQGPSEATAPVQSL